MKEKQRERGGGGEKDVTAICVLSSAVSDVVWQLVHTPKPEPHIGFIYCIPGWREGERKREEREGEGGEGEREERERGRIIGRACLLCVYSQGGSARNFRPHKLFTSVIS